MEENGIYYGRLFSGITRPKEAFKGMHEAEDVKGLGWRIVELFVG